MANQLLLQLVRRAPVGVRRPQRVDASEHRHGRHQRLLHLGERRQRAHVVRRPRARVHAHEAAGRHRRLLARQGGGARLAHAQQRLAVRAAAGDARWRHAMPAAAALGPFDGGERVPWQLRRGWRRLAVGCQQGQPRQRRQWDVLVEHLCGAHEAAAHAAHQRGLVVVQVVAAVYGHQHLVHLAELGRPVRRRERLPSGWQLPADVAAQQGGEQSLAERGIVGRGSGPRPHASQDVDAVAACLSRRGLPRSQLLLHRGRVHGSCQLRVCLPHGLDARARGLCQLRRIRVWRQWDGRHGTLHHRSRAVACRDAGAVAHGGIPPPPDGGRLSGGPLLHVGHGVACSASADTEGGAMVKTRLHLPTCSAVLGELEVKKAIVSPPQGGETVFAALR